MALITTAIQECCVWVLSPRFLPYNDLRFIHVLVIL